MDLDSIYRLDDFEASYNQIWCSEIEKKQRIWLICCYQTMQSTIRGYATMNQDNVVQFKDRALFTDALTSLLQRGAQQLIMQSVEAELDEFMSQFKDRQTQDGRAAVVRNGYQPERQIETAIGPVKVKIPKVRAKDGKPVTFHSEHYLTIRRGQ